MLNSAVIQVSIECSFEKAYAFLSDPLNYPRLSPIPDVVLEPVAGDPRAFIVELPDGRGKIRFSPANGYGVLDYTVADLATGSERTTPVRLVPNQDGSELLMLLFQRPEADDARFASDVEWVRNDLIAIKSLLEAL